MQDGFVKNANAVVQPNQTVTVRVMSVDASTGRIALTMKGMSGGGRVVVGLQKDAAQRKT